MNDVIRHYDALIEENNDPVYDSEPLKAYMDKWDGQDFIEEMLLNTNKSVLEIGVGTGRLAVRVAPLCKEFIGIDISPKTADRARENLNRFSNINVFCLDFMEYHPNRQFDVIYSSLTFMHISDKIAAIEKVRAMLKAGGRFVLSIDKSQDNFIDYGIRKIAVFPDRQDTMSKYLTRSGMKILKQYETEFAYIFVASNVTF